MKNAASTSMSRIGERTSWLRLGASPFVFALFALALLLMVPQEAMAQTLSVPFVDTIGCNVVKWMKGPLAVLIFIVVLIAIMVIGMIAKMDWGRIISLAVIYGILQGIVGMLLATGQIAIPASCL